MDENTLNKYLRYLKFIVLFEAKKTICFKRKSVNSPKSRSFKIRVG